MMRDATLKQWSELCVFYHQNQRLLREKDFGDKTQLGEYWQQMTFNKIILLMYEGRNVKRLTQ